jgi:hypothetical protein
VRPTVAARHRLPRRPKQLSAVSVLASRSTECCSTESRPTESRSTECRSTESRPTESRSTESRPTESRSTECRSTESRPTESRPTDSARQVLRMADAPGAEIDVYVNRLDSVLGKKMSVISVSRAAQSCSLLPPSCLESAAGGAGHQAHSGRQCRSLPLSVYLRVRWEIMGLVTTARSPTHEHELTEILLRFYILAIP